MDGTPVDVQFKQSSLWHPLDILLALFFLIAGVWLTYAHFGEEGSEAHLYVDNQKVAWYLLKGDSAVFEVKTRIGITLIERKQQGIRVISAPCAHQICRKRGAISSTHQSIICVPGKLAVRIVGAAKENPGKPTPDAISF